MKDIFNKLASTIQSSNSLYAEVQELEAIWPPYKVKANDVLTSRITVGDLVTVKDGKLVNEGANTHVITTCWGTMVSDFSISVAKLNTLELSKIKL